MSLRDVERVLKVMTWFHSHRGIFQHMDALVLKRREAGRDIGIFEDCVQESNPGSKKSGKAMNHMTRSLILALGVCYHAGLEKRAEYRGHVASHFTRPLARVTSDMMLDEITM